MRRDVFYPPTPYTTPTFSLSSPLQAAVSSGKLEHPRHQEFAMKIGAYASLLMGTIPAVFMRRDGWIATK